MTANTETKSTPRTVQGKVVSDKMQNTIVVEIERRVKHRVYGKYIRKTSKLYAHDSEGVAKIGDQVVITESRPISKTKRWKLVEIISL